MSVREITFAEAIREGTAQAMEQDPNVFIMGLGVPDPKGTFGTTLGLQQQFGSERVFDIPTSENAMTGIAIGAALAGKRPILTHQRVDFALLSMEQIVNQAAKWHYMFGGQSSVPIVIRMIIGQGWGQGPQHSQSLHALFAHIPGLKVVMPATPKDAKGLLIASIQDNNPVIFLEHRWLHNVRGPVEEKMYSTPLGQPHLMRQGSDVTIVALSNMVIETLKVYDELTARGISADVIDVRTLRPLDFKMIHDSVKKTGRLLIAETGTVTLGFGAEIISRVVETQLKDLKAAPVRIGLPDFPAPTSHALAQYYFPRSDHILAACESIMGRTPTAINKDTPSTKLDIPDASFKGPF